MLNKVGCRLLVRYGPAALPEVWWGGGEPATASENASSGSVLAGWMLAYRAGVNNVACYGVLVGRHASSLRGEGLSRTRFPSSPLQCMPR